MKNGLLLAIITLFTISLVLMLGSINVRLDEVADGGIDHGGYLSQIPLLVYLFLIIQVAITVYSLKNSEISDD